MKIKIMSSARACKKEEGAVLLESLIAILIFSMGILAVAGLQAAMLRNSTDARYRAEASFIAQQRIGQMWSDLENLPSYLEENTDISQLLPNGTRTVTFPSLTMVRVKVTWKMPGEEVAHNFTMDANVSGG